MKVIKVYYKGTCQEFSVGDGTTSEEIFELMKRIFFIKEDISNYFLQDSEGRVVILPKILPEELSVFCFLFIIIIWTTRNNNNYFFIIKNFLFIFSKQQEL